LRSRSILNGHALQQEVPSTRYGDNSTNQVPISHYTLHTTHYTLHTTHYTPHTNTFSLSHSDLTKEFTWSVIDRWATHPRFIELVAKKIKEGLNLFPSDEARKDAIIMFSAHSLPHKVTFSYFITGTKHLNLCRL